MRIILNDGCLCAANGLREHFAYMEPRPFYAANVAPFVAFVAVPVGVLAVTQIAEAAPQDSCVSSAAAQYVQDGNFYADGRDDTRGGPAGVVCNQAMINGVTTEQTADAAAQLADAAAQGRDVGTLALPQSNGSVKQVPYKVEERYTGAAEVDMPLLDGVEAPASGANIPSNPFRKVAVQSRLRVRSSPSEQNGEVTGEYDPGAIVEVQAITADGSWALVSYGGFGVGYVSTRYLSDAPAGTGSADAVRPQRPTPPPPVIAAVAKPRPAANSRKPKPQEKAPEQVLASASPPKFDVYKVHVMAPCQTFVIDNKRNQACGFGGGTIAYNSDVPKLQS